MICKQIIEQKFKKVDHYIETFNGSKSARLSGYSEKASKEIAYGLLTKTHIKDAIKERSLSHTLSDGSAITENRLIKEIGRIAFFDIRKLFDGEGNLLAPDQWDDDTALAIYVNEALSTWC